MSKLVGSVELYTGLSKSHHIDASMQAVTWFTGIQSDLQYIPELHGTVCEWLADIIAAPVEKRTEEMCCSGSLSSEVRTISTCM